MFKPAADGKFPALEEEVLAFWKKHRIYEKSLEQRAQSPRFVFYEGPPTANGLPHPGHCLTRAIKDLFPRYRTMRGYRCERKAGWDTHGLPVEVEVCKDLGIHSKEEIESFGVESFIHTCQESVWRYMQQWERLTERIGFWINLDEAYVTYHQSYVESVWWSLKEFFDRGLLYQGHKIVWWWAQGGTALSSGEVGQGYREVADPSVFVRCPLVDDPDTSLLVWTTTPWTLPSNQFIAVHPDLEYAKVSDAENGRNLLMAAALVDTISEKVKRPLTVQSRCTGHELLGTRYIPPFDYYYERDGQRTGTLKQGGSQHVAWRVVPADFVTVESGTGLVHQAPAFGEVDYEVLLDEQRRFADGEGPPLVCGVGPDGKFTEQVPDYRGRWVKEAEKDLCRQMRDRGVLYHQEQYLHDYPFCWRAEEDPLIQYPRKSWFIRTTDFKDRLLANNRKINWLPEHIREGRMGNFLETNVDWALSRERYWGTPLPIWVCDQTGQMESIASYDELLCKPGVRGTEVWEEAKAKKPSLPDDLKVHKPYIDAVTYDSPFASSGRMQRVPEVIDCWYDSGAMPFAQWGYPHKNREQFENQFPAHFISEALDQTRGWFYSLLAISTLLFSDDQDEPDSSQHAYPHPYQNCIVLGLMLAETYICSKCSNRHQEVVSQCEQCGGPVVRRVEKMSKRLRNYREPQEIFDRYGADALRWYFFANQPPWTSVIYSERAIKDSIPEFLLRLWNCYSFLVIYSETSGFDPSRLLCGEANQLTPADLSQARGYRPARERGELDRWVLSELNRTIAGVVERMDTYDNYNACLQLHEFVDALSNWYVRRSRDRFWTNWCLQDAPGQEIKLLPVERIDQLNEESREKLDAYWTLYECLLATSKLIAPFTPFMAETLWQNLAGVFGQRAAESVHLCDYPASQQTVLDKTLSERMHLLREVASLGRAARMDAKLKVRQPLAKVEVILADSSHQTWLADHGELLQNELNVKQIEYTTETQQYISYQVHPNFKRLGPRVGKLMPAVKRALLEADGGGLLAEMKATGKIVLDVSGQMIPLDEEDIQIRLQAKEGWAAAQGTGCVVVLSTELTPVLVREGHARDVVRLIQDRRKQMDCQFADRITVGVGTQCAELKTAIEENREYIQRETLAVKIVFDSLPATEGAEHEVSGFKVSLYVKVSTESQ